MGIEFARCSRATGVMPDRIVVLLYQHPESSRYPEYSPKNYAYLRKKRAKELVQEKLDVLFDIVLLLLLLSNFVLSPRSP